MAAPSFLHKLFADSSVQPPASQVSTRTLTTTTATPTGSLIVIGILADKSTGTVSTAADAVTDSAGNTYTVYSQSNGGTIPGFATLAYARATSPLPSGGTVTVKFSEATQPMIGGVVFSNLNVPRIGEAQRHESDSDYTGTADDGDQFVSLAPSSGTGYAVALIGTYASYNLEATTGLTGSTKLLSALSPTSLTIANGHNMQFEMVWTPAGISTTTKVGVSINNATSVGYHASGIVLPEFTAGSSLEQVIALF